VLPLLPSTDNLVVLLKSYDYLLESQNINLNIQKTNSGQKQRAKINGPWQPEVAGFKKRYKEIQQKTAELTLPPF
jgi:hypothetical protein